MTVFGGGALRRARPLSCRPFSFLFFLDTSGSGRDDETGFMSVIVSVDTEANDDLLGVEPVSEESLPGLCGFLSTLAMITRDALLESKNRLLRRAKADWGEKSE